MNLQMNIEALGYLWQGTYSSNNTYTDRDVVFKDGGSYVMRNGAWEPFALGQRDAVTKGHMLTGGTSVGGIDGQALHSNVGDSIEFRYTDDRNGTTVARLMETVQNHRGGYATNRFGMFVMTDGTVRGIGRADSGQLGDGITASAQGHWTASRTVFPKGVKIARVICTWANSFYIDTTGGLWYSGSNDANCMSGRGLTGVVRTPVKLNGFSGIPANAKIVDVHCHYGNTNYPTPMARDDQGRVYVWGYNQTGCAGLGVTGVITTATLIPITATVPMKYAVTNGGYYGASCLIDYNGYAWTCGDNALSYNTTSSHTVHNRLDLGGRRVKKMFWGEDDQHWVAGQQYDWGAGILFENGDVYIRGVGAGQTGMGYSMAGDLPPTGTPFHTGVKDIWVQFGGYQVAIALMNDGTVQARGYQGFNINGANSTDTTTWATIGAGYLTNITKLVINGAQYGSTGAALRSDGQLVVWGGGLAGQAGNGLFTESQMPNSFFLSERPIVDFAFGGFRYEGTHNNVVYALNDLGQVLVSGQGEYSMNGDDDSENTGTPQIVRF